MPLPRLVLLCLLLCLLQGGVRLSVAQSQPLPPDACSGLDAAARTDALACLTLAPTALVPGTQAQVQLGRVPSPFGVAVTPDGHHRYDLLFNIAGLPDPATLGPYTTYVAWLTTPVFSPVVRLGTVANGRAAVGRVDGFNKFVVLVSAEATADVAERTGPLVLRGTSPSSRMQGHDLVMAAPLALQTPTDTAAAAMGGMMEGMAMDSTAMAAHLGLHAAMARPPMHPDIKMPPGLMGLVPQVHLWLPHQYLNSYPEARPREQVRLADGDTLALEAGLVRRTIRGRPFIMYGFNGQYPGPLIEVDQAATIVVQFTNKIEWPMAVHWHGVRLDNRYDGVPHLTQPPVQTGETFTYEVHLPDAGLYWYHPHHREDITQDLGLYGNLLVRAPEADYYNTVHREEVLMLDDLTLNDQGLVPYGSESANFMLMGRFGNVFLVNGAPDYTRMVRRGEVVRFFLTNVSNTRTFNLSFGGLPVKVVGSDVSRFEHEAWARSVVIAPAERYIVEVRFPEAGLVPLTNRVQAINHTQGAFFAEVDTLAHFLATEAPATPDLGTAFEQLRAHAEVTADIDRYRQHFDRPVDHELVLNLKVDNLPPVVTQLMRLDRTYFNPVEWSGTMPMMNWASSGAEVQWLLEDPATGAENMAIDSWRFKVGDVVKLRVHNSRDAFHAMQHPLHLHGQRFLVLSVDGVPNDNLVWKDTVLLPVGATADLLLELSNPGRWMLHCHIAEHLESGMKLVFDVAE